MEWRHFLPGGHVRPQGVAVLAQRQGGGWETSQRPTQPGANGGGEDDECEKHSDILTPPNPGEALTLATGDSVDKGKY